MRYYRIGRPIAPGTYPELQGNEVLEVHNNYSNIISNSWFEFCKLYSCNDDDSNRNNI